MAKPSRSQQHKGAAVIVFFSGMALIVIIMEMVGLAPISKQLFIITSSSSSPPTAHSSSPGTTTKIGDMETSQNRTDDDTPHIYSSGKNDEPLEPLHIKSTDADVDCLLINQNIFEDIEVNYPSSLHGAQEREAQDDKMYKDSRKILEEDNNNASKPYLIYHIGPPKTATTTIQDTLREFESNGLFSNNDKYIFFSNNENVKINPLEPLIADDKCHEMLEAMENQHQQEKVASMGINNTTSMSDALLIKKIRVAPCWQNLVQQNLEVHLQNHTNVLYSKEMISARHSKSVSRFHRIAKLLEPDWNVMIIVTYRRLFEHKWSLKTQREEWTPSKMAMNRWVRPCRIPKPFYPKFTERETSEGLIRHWTDEIHSPYSSSPLIFRLANFHHSRGILLSFVCDVLPNANHSCQRLIDEQQKKKNVVRLSNPANELFYYDVLAVMASKQKQFSNMTKHFKRRHVYLKLFDYQTTILNQTWHDFPVTCPTRDQMKDFLEQSLERERSVYPRFESNQHCLHQQEEEHRNQFWKYYDKEKYCYIDHKKVLQQPEWVSFFTKLAMGDDSM